MGHRLALALMCGLVTTSLSVNGSLASAAPTAAAVEKPQVHALVFPDRDNPDVFVFVENFRVNATVSNPGGDDFFVLRTPQGTFDMPFESVVEVEFLTFRRMDFLESATYDVRVVLPDHGVRRGVLELQGLQGHVGKSPWSQALMTRGEYAERLHRILFTRRN